MKKRGSVAKNGDSDTDYLYLNHHFLQQNLPSTFPKQTETFVPPISIPTMFSLLLLFNQGPFIS